MKFVSKTAKQIEEEQLLSEGKYPFTIKVVEEKDDKNRQPFFKLKLYVHAPDGRDWHVYDNVSMAWMAHKFLHLCDTVGLAAQYERGEIHVEDLISRQGYCEIGMEEAKGGYAAKNIVNDYVTAKEIRREEPKATIDDDVPF